MLPACFVSHRPASREILSLASCLL
jgi:hypothetical protein